MAKPEMYRQGTLTMPAENGTLKRTIWGPADYMVVGREVKVEEHDGSWTHGWTVEAVHGEPEPKEYVQKLAHAHTRQRAASDI